MGKVPVLLVLLLVALTFVWGRCPLDAAGSYTDLI